MPISKYYGGHGEEVMRGMVKSQGEKAGEREFYATANAKGQKPARDGILHEAKEMFFPTPPPNGGYPVSSSKESAEDEADFRSRMHRALDCMLNHAGYEFRATANARGQKPAGDDETAEQKRDDRMIMHSSYRRESPEEEEEEGEGAAEDGKFRARMHRALDCVLDHAGYVGGRSGSS
jgi:hypothetical protein